MSTLFHRNFDLQSLFKPYELLNFATSMSLDKAQQLHVLIRFTNQTIVHGLCLQSRNAWNVKQEQQVEKKRDGVETNEWAIIELQGDLESRSGQSLNDQFIGDLHFTKTGTPILIVGHHILYGKEVKMEKPFAVLEKTRYDQDGNRIDKTVPRLGTRTDYIARAIVKKKLIFKVRPKPIIANAPKMI